MVISGRVQGVWFRGWTLETARALGLDGWVCNRRDGTVEAVFEGSPEAVAELVGFCREGPSWAQVDRVEVIEESPEELRGFRVR